MDGFVFPLALSASVDVGVGVEPFDPSAFPFWFWFVVVVVFPSLEEDENSENVFPNIPPFPEASVVVVVAFPDASIEEDENSENGSSFCENKSLILVVPPNNDEII